MLWCNGDYHGILRDIKAVLLDGEVCLKTHIGIHLGTDPYGSILSHRMKRMLNYFKHWNEGNYAFAWLSTVQYSKSPEEILTSLEKEVIPTLEQMLVFVAKWPCLSLWQSAKCLWLGARSTTQCLKSPMSLKRLPS